MTDPRDLDQLTESVLATTKYRAIAPELVRSIGARELSQRRSVKEAIKATKNKLHQIAGAYQSGRPDYAAWLEVLRKAQAEDLLRSGCAEIMARHASTAERLPILDRFYSTLLAEMAPVASILDLGCGLHPLSLPWMGLDQRVAYHAYDIYQDQSDFLNAYFDLTGVNGTASVWDLLQGCPTQAADVAFLLKVIPCLEQIDKSIGVQLLDTVRARVILVSFPAHSLGGRSKGMVHSYAAHFDELTQGRGWSAQRFEFDSELVFRLSRA